MGLHLLCNRNFTASRRCGLLLVLLYFGTVWVLLHSDVCAQTDSDQNPELVPCMRVLLLPAYDLSRIFGEDVSLTGPLSGNVFVTSSVASEATNLIYMKLKRALTGMRPIQVITADREAGTNLVGIDPVTGRRRERIAAIQELGRQNKAEGVFCTFIYAFRERIGSTYGAEQPARVSFEVNMISVATGRIIWQSHFTETQKTLSDNVLQIGRFLKRKGRWITAEEMADGAVNDLMNAFENEFLRVPH